MKANNSEEDILRMPILNFNTGDLPPDSGRFISLPVIAN
jgi:hypothetical protein